MRLRTSLRTSLVAGLLLLPLGVPSSVAVAATVHEGDFDAGFAQAGRVRTAFVSGGNDEAHAVAVAPDGKIVVAGKTFDAATGDYAMGIVVYNPDGTLDTAFSHGGLKAVGFGNGTESEAHAVLVQPDGKILVAGAATGVPAGHFVIARLTPTGGLDTTFDTDGVKVFELNGSGGINALALQPDGKIVAVGPTAPTGRLDFAVVRLKPGGAFDGTFGTGGEVTTGFGTDADIPTAVVVQTDGKIVVGGHSDYPGTSSVIEWAVNIARYLPGGGLDSSFGTGGKTTTDLSTDTDEFLAGMALLPDGRLVAAGYRTDTAGSAQGGLLLRYSSAGALAPSATAPDAGWVLKTAFSQINALVRQRDGKLVAVGTFANTGSSFVVGRYNVDFAPDPHFAGDGEESVPFGAQGFDDAYATALQRDGKILIAGRTYTGVFTPSAGGDIYNFATARLIGDATPPTGERLSALPVFSRARTVHLGWSAKDDNTGVRSYDVRAHSAAASKSTYGGWRTVISGSTKKSATVTATAGRTWCYEVRARDWAGNVSAWSAPRCTAVPVDDRAMSARGAWTKSGVTSDYLGTVSTSTASGSSLTTSVAFRRLALLVRTCPGCGKVKVMLGSKVLATVTLAASTTHHRVLKSVVIGSTLRTGTLRLVQASGGHSVVIDGVGVSLV
ncbi:MAG TPA: delta-60 repeat domain-containing protein [Mycobacteriales bacterium]|nr:delta-60 repeat domain-containing protein [Mycobacteriales bacterium]